MALSPLIAVLLTTLLATSYGEESKKEPVASARISTIQKKILQEIPKGWKVYRSSSQIVLTLSNVRFLNSINGPPLSEEELWKKYSWNADYIITIRQTRALSQEDYDVLLAARKKLRFSMSRRVEDYTGMHRAADEFIVQSSIPLPLCRIGKQSIWISVNDRIGRHWVRPEAASILYQRLIKVLSDKGEPYKK